MPQLIVSIDGVVIKEVELTKYRTTLGRRPYNDVVIDHLTVSGEHAVMQMSGSEFYLEDLESTNGSHVNGKAIKRQLLQNGDIIEMGKCKIQFLGDGGAASADPTSGAAADAEEGAVNPLARVASIRVMSGNSAGRELSLVKVVTTIGKPGVAVAAITRHPTGYVVAWVEGSIKPTVNGTELSTEGVSLRNGDLIELGGTQMQFILS